MTRALELARRGGTATRPNPLVGCVIANAATGHVLAEGWHQHYGGPHAEVNAVAALPAPADLRGCRVFVTLEPCAHFGKTPPCADLLIRHQATDVVVATLDPNPLVAGRGVEKLRAAGCRVAVGLLEAEAQWLNRRFFTAQQHQRPWIVLKWAESADGRLAGADRRPVAITGELTRRLVHRWRTEEAAILIGAGTARADNPRLDVRHWPGPAPVRVVLAGGAPLPPDLHLLQAGGVETIVYDHQSLPAVLADLHARGLHSVLVEGGAAVLQAFLDADLWDEIRVLRNPALRLPGGIGAPEIPIGAVLREQYGVGGDEVREYRR